MPQPGIFKLWAYRSSTISRNRSKASGNRSHDPGLDQILKKHEIAHIYHNIAVSNKNGGKGERQDSHSDSRDRWHSHWACHR